METFVIHSRLWDDPAFAGLSPIGQLTYLKLARVCDGNWGIVGYRDLRLLAADLWPDQAVQVLYGDAAALGLITEAEAQIRAAIVAGLLIDEETRDGRVIGYRGWESYTGAKRRGRGRPEHPMGPSLAGSRDWSKLHPNSRQATQEWATRLGIGDNIANHGTQSSTTSRTTVHEVPELRGPLPGAGGRGPGTGVNPGIRVPGAGNLRAGAREGPAAAGGDGDGSGEGQPPSPAEAGSPMGTPAPQNATQLAMHLAHRIGTERVMDADEAVISQGFADVVRPLEKLALFEGATDAYLSWCADKARQPTCRGLGGWLSREQSIRASPLTPTLSRGERGKSGERGNARGNARERMTPKSAGDHAREQAQLRDPAFVAAMDAGQRRKLYNVGAIVEEAMPEHERAGADTGHDATVEGV